MRILVEAYSGCTANERPLRFTAGGHTLAIVAVLDRWRSETARSFRVRADDGNVYVLKYTEPDDRWELASFIPKAAPKAPPREPIRRALH